MSENGSSTAGGRQALLVLDMQTVFIGPEGPFANTTAGPVVDGVNDVAARCRAAGVPVLFSRYTLRDDLADAGLLRGVPFVEAGHMCSSSPSAALDARIHVEAGDHHLEHHRPSAFFESDLDSVLRALGVDSLIIAGVSTNNAVSATARDAFARDIPVLVPRQAVAAAPGEDDAETYLGILDRWTATVVDSDQLTGGGRSPVQVT